MNSSSRPVCITGMHRSGTSMVAHVLNVCGLYLGDPDELLAPKPDNPDGFWENREFVALNDELLAAFGGAWDHPPTFSAGWENDSRVAPLFDRAVALAARMRVHGPWGWKDPRNSLTIEFWKRVIPDLRIIVCVRNPLEVAASLAQRGAASRPFTFSLWVQYDAALRRGLDGMEFTATLYDAYFHNARAEIVRLSRWCSLTPDDATIDRAAGIPNADLRHSTRNPTQLRGSAPNDLVERYLNWCAHTDTARASTGVDTRAAQAAGQVAALTDGERADSVDYALRLLADANARASEAERSARMAADSARSAGEQARSLRSQLDSILSSGSWRVTQPLRSMRRSVNRLLRSIGH